MANANKRCILVAIGGNALMKEGSFTLENQLEAASETARHLVALVEQGHDIIITHGNGPQVGHSLLRSEVAHDVVPPVSLEACVAETQGLIGFQLSTTMQNALHAAGLERDVVAMVTHVLVDPDDPAFHAPTKPIGLFMSEGDAKRLMIDKGWTVKEDSGRGWRRVVASPKPVEVVELAAIKKLCKQGMIVVCVGGGGIPVMRDPEGRFKGVPAVIDKDASSRIVANAVGEDIFLLSSVVEKGSLFFGTPKQREVDVMTLSEAKQFMADGHFPPGSMGPKVQAAIDYLDAGGVEVIIARPQDISAAVRGEAGTRIVRD